MFAKSIAMMFSKTFVEAEIMDSLTARDMGLRMLPFLKLQADGFVVGEIMRSFDQYSEFPKVANSKVKRLVNEGICWLASQGFIAKDHEIENREVFFVTRNGRDVDGTFDYDTQVRLARFPYDSMHPVVTNEGRTQMERQEFGSVVVDVYKYVETFVHDLEIEFCDVRKLHFKDIAFNAFKNLGEYSGMTKEADATAQILTSAYSLYRNPVSHQASKVDYERAFDAVSVLSAVMRQLDVLVEEATRGREAKRALVG